MPERVQAGNWLVARFLPCSLFSLKISTATSSVAKTLLVPTPWSIKLALLDASFTAQASRDECASLVKSLKNVDVRVAPPSRAVVTHSIIHVRQEPKEPDPTQPYTGSIAYREFVFYPSEWRWAFHVGDRPVELHRKLEQLLPYIRYIGKRGSFVQFLGCEWVEQLDITYTQPLNSAEIGVPERAHIVPLDDFGPEVTLDVLDSYSSQKVVAGKHRIFVNTIVPLGIVSSGPYFTEYRGN